MSDIFDAKCPLKSPASKEGKLQLASIFIERCDEVLKLLDRRYETDKRLNQQHDRFHIDSTEFFKNMKSFYVAEHADFKNLPEDEDNMIDATIMFNPTNDMNGFVMLRNHIDWLLSSMKELTDDPKNDAVFYLQVHELRKAIMFLDRAYKLLLRKD